MSVSVCCDYHLFSSKGYSLYEGERIVVIAYRDNGHKKVLEDGIVRKINSEIIVVTHKNGDESIIRIPDIIDWY